MWCLSLNNFVIVRNIAVMNRVELAVCRIREKLPGNERFVSKGSACVAHCERLASSWGWKCQNFIVSSSIVLCKRDFSSPDKIFLAEFLSKDKKSLEVFELRSLAEVSRDVAVRNLNLNDKEESLSFLSVEPLDKRGFLKKMVKKSTLQTFRPLDCADFERNKLEDELRDGLYCHVVVDSFEPEATNVPFVTKTLKLVYDFQTRQFNLQDFSGIERVHDKEEIPTGAVITTKKGEFVGVLDFVENVLSPLFFHESRIADSERNEALNNNLHKEEIKVDGNDVTKCEVLDGGSPSETPGVSAELPGSNNEPPQVSIENVMQGVPPRNDNTEIVGPNEMVTVEKGMDMRVNNGTRFTHEEDNSLVNLVPDVDFVAEPLEEHPVRHSALDPGDKTSALTSFSEMDTSEIESECESRAVGHVQPSEQQQPDLSYLEANNKTILSSEINEDLFYTVIQVGETFSDVETTTLESVKLVNEETAGKESDLPEPGVDCEWEKDKVDMDEFHMSSDILDTAANGLDSLENTNSDCVKVETVTNLVTDHESVVNVEEDANQNVQITSDILDGNDFASDKTIENRVPSSVAPPVECLVEMKGDEEDKVNNGKSDVAEKLEDVELDNSTVSGCNFQREGIGEQTQNTQCNGQEVRQKVRKADVDLSEHSALSDGLKRDKEESLQINVTSGELEAKQVNTCDELSLSLQDAKTCKGEKEGEVETVNMGEITDANVTSVAATEEAPEVQSVECWAGEQEKAPLNIVIEGTLSASADFPTYEQHSRGLSTAAAVPAANLDREEMSHKTVQGSLATTVAVPAANLEQEEMSHKTVSENLPTAVAVPAANLEQEEMSHKTVSENLPTAAAVPAANLEQEEMSHKTVSENLPTAAAVPAANLEQEEMSHKTVSENLSTAAAVPAANLEQEEMSHKTLSENLPTTVAVPAANPEQEEMSHKTVPESVTTTVAVPAANLEQEQISLRNVPDKDSLGYGITPQRVSADSLLTDTITNNRQALKDLGQCLNTEYQYGRIPCWRDLAELLGIPVEVYEHCSTYSENSPTEDLFAFLAATKPQLTLKDVLDALRQIDRHDVAHLLDRKIGSGVFSDESPVGSLVEREDTAILGEVAVKLDKKCKNNWKALAAHLTVPRRVLRNFGSQTGHNSALMLLKFIPIFDPERTIRDLKHSLNSIQREDVIGILDGAGIPGDDQVKDILDDTDLVEQITDLLNGDPPYPNWRQLAGELGIPDEKCKIFEPVEDNQSPITLLFKSIEKFDPELTFEELILALVAMKRQDALDVLQKYFSSEDINQILEENNLFTPSEEKLN